MTRAERSPCVGILEAFGHLRDAVQAVVLLPAGSTLLLSRTAAVLHALRDLEAVRGRIELFRADLAAQWGLHEAIRSATAIVTAAGTPTALAAVVLDRGVVAAAAHRIVAAVEAHTPLPPATSALLDAAAADELPAADVARNSALGGFWTGGAGGERDGVPRSYASSPASGYSGGGEVGGEGRRGGGSDPGGGLSVSLPTFSDLFRATYAADHAWAGGVMGAATTAASVGGVPVAVEVVAESAITPATARALRLRTRLRHPNLVTLYGVAPAPAGALDGEPALAVVTAAAPGGMLFDAMNSRALDTAAKLSTLTDIAAALTFLHASDHVHLGVHPGNVAYTTGRRVAMLANPAMVPPDDTPASPADLDARKYSVAPEMARKVGASFPADVWAFGTVAYALFSGHEPYKNVMDSEGGTAGGAVGGSGGGGNLLSRLLEGTPPPRSALEAAATPSPIVDLIYECCLLADPRDRAPAWMLLNRLKSLRRSAPALWGATPPLAPMNWEAAIATGPGSTRAAGHMGMRALYRLRFRGEPLSSTANLRFPLPVFSRRVGVAAPDAGAADAAWNLHACFRRGHHVAADARVAMDWLVRSRVLAAAAAGRAAAASAAAAAAATSGSRGTLVHFVETPAEGIKRRQAAAAVAAASATAATIEPIKPRSLASLGARDWSQSSSTAGYGGAGGGGGLSSGASTSSTASGMVITSPGGPGALGGGGGMGGAAIAVVPSPPPVTPERAAELIAALDAEVILGGVGGGMAAGGVGFESTGEGASLSSFGAAGDAGDAAEATYQLGMIAEMGWAGCPKDELRASQLYEAAMGCGHADATNAMGERYTRSGDLRRASAAYLTAESLGSLAATVNRALAIVDPRSIVAPPPAAAGTPAAPADVTAVLLSGSTGTNGGAGPRSTTTSTTTARLRVADVPREDAVRAFGFLDSAAHAGSTLALYLSGLCYATGLGTARHAYQAFERFSVAAGRGHAAAAHALARCYGAGVGTAPSPSSAASWLRRAAAGHHPPALTELGERHRDGAPAVGIAVDAGRARRLFSAAASAGDAAGKRNLAGVLLPSAPADAAKLLEEAAAGGDGAAALVLAGLLDRGADGAGGRGGATATAAPAPNGGDGAGGSGPPDVQVVRRNASAAERWYARAAELGAPAGGGGGGGVARLPSGASAGTAPPSPAPSAEGGVDGRGGVRRRPPAGSKSSRVAAMLRRRPPST
ncbi:hypothetical protein MMPV_009873 [Pyropia vietnamensis]